MRNFIKLMGNRAQFNAVVLIITHTNKNVSYKRIDYPHTTAHNHSHLIFYTGTADLRWWVAERWEKQSGYLTGGRIKNATVRMRFLFEK